jgi:chloramphenicol 3-O phosphotransferase
LTTATIIVLNGASSSGKTSIARAFQELVPELFLNFSIDSILDTLPPALLTKLETGELTGRDVRYAELVRGFYACVRELANTGLDLIIGHAIVSQSEAELLRAATNGHRTFLIGIDCPADVLTERERARGNRRPGMAAAQSERIHQWLEYDLRIDTSRVDAITAARQIASLIG